VVGGQIIGITLAKNGSNGVDRMSIGLLVSELGRSEDWNFLKKKIFFVFCF
jgi:hypothetical protein